MAAKILKYAALPAAALAGLGSLRIYSINEKTNEELISPRELSIYSPDVPAVQFVEEQPGVIQTGLGSVRVGLQPYARAVQSGFTSAKVRVISLYHAGQDTYHYLRDPPPGFLPRVGVISVSGLAGLILARKGSHLKRIVVSLGLAATGTAVCYPTQTVGALKITGKKVYTVSSSVASMFKSKPKEDVVMTAVNVQSPAAVASQDVESPTKAFSELPPETVPVPVDETILDEKSTPEPSLDPIAETIESMPEPVPLEPVVEAPAADSVIDTAPEPTPSAEMVVTSVVVSVPEIVPVAAPQLPCTYDLKVPVPMEVTEEATPSTTPTVEETTSPAPVLPEDATPTTVDEEPASVAPPPDEEAIPPAEASQPTADEATPSSEAPVVEPATVKSRFVPDPSLLDHGQSNPEDADMYSTRS